MVVDEYVLALDQTEGRLNASMADSREMAASEPYRETVSWLRCFRGIDTLTAIMLLAELHDVRRFRAPRALMAYIGLVPAKTPPVSGIGAAALRVRATPSSVACWSRRTGTISTARHGRALAQRRAGQPPHVIAMADKAQHRLCSRFRQLAERHKHGSKIAVAIARELSGFLWAVLSPQPAAPVELSQRRTSATHGDDHGQSRHECGG